MENIAAITIEFMGFTHQLITVPHPVDIGPRSKTWFQSTLTIFDLRCWALREAAVETIPRQAPSP